MFLTISVKCYLVCETLLQIFRLLLCYTTDAFLEFFRFLKIFQLYQNFCFVPLVSRFHLKVQCLFYIFYFWKIFDGLRIKIWTWSSWYCSKLYLYNALSLMLYLPCTKHYYWETYWLGHSLICLYSYLFLLELTTARLSLSC